MPSAPKLKKSYEYIRPDFILPEDKKHSYAHLAILSEYNQKVIDILKDKKSVCMIDNINYDEKIYSDLLNNCDTFINDGNSSFLSDAFYNQKYCLMYPNYNDIESIINCYINQYYNLGSMDISSAPQKIEINIDNNIKFIAEEIKRFK